MSSIAVRPATRADRHALWSLVRDFGTSYRPERAAFDRTLDLVLTDEESLLLVAAIEDSVRGYLLGHRRATFFANRPVLWIEELMVEASHRRSGVGAALMTAAEERASNDGCAYVSLASRRAGDFYRAIGYRESAAFFKKPLAP